MQQLRQKLADQRNNYRLWSLNKHFPKRTVGISLMVVAVVVAAVVQIMPTKAAGSATLTLSSSPVSGNVENGQTLTLKIHLNTAGEAVNAVQANLTYPTAKFDAATVACDGGGQLPNSAQTVATGGNIKVACYITPGGSTVNGSVDFATITLHASATGSAPVAFVVSGDDESAIARASNSTNSLGTATGATYTVISADTTPPVTSVTAPTASARVGGTAVAVTADATDVGGAGVTGVTFKFDAASDGSGGTTIGSTDTSSPYAVTWNTATCACDGSHTLRAIAVDGAVSPHTTVSSPITVTVDNVAPTTSIDSGPLEGSSSTSTSATFGFSSADGTATFECKIDSGSYSSCTSTKAYTSLAIGAHTFSVRASDTATPVNVGAATVRHFTVTDGVAPSAPSGLTGTTPTSTQVNLSWTAATDNVAVTGYKVYRDGSLLSAGTIGNVLLFVDNTAVASTSYDYTVKAFDAAANLGVDSNTFHVTTPATGSDATAPTAPTNFKFKAVQATSIKVSWSASTDAGGSGLAGYKVYRDSSLAYTGTALTFTDTGRTTGTTYAYTVRAYDNAGNLSTVVGPISYQAKTIPGDIVADGAINGLDLGRLLNVYNQFASADPTSNLADNGGSLSTQRINGLDLAVILNSYGEPRTP